MQRTVYKRLIEDQRKLSDILSVSGHEGPMAKYIRSRIKNKVDKLWLDPLGSLFAVLEGGTDKRTKKLSAGKGLSGSRTAKNKSKKGSAQKQKSTNERIMLDAHMDEVGFMVSHIDKLGFIRFVPIGGWDTRILAGQAVKILSKDGKEISGVIGAKPPHLLTKEERNRILNFKDLYIDMGFLSSKDAHKNGIEMGSVGTLDSPFTELANGLIRGKAFDNRTGVNILLQLIDKYSQKRPGSTLLFSFSVQEEVGLRGAGPAAFSLDPSMAIVVENTTAGDVPGISESDCPAVLGKGPAITIADNHLLSSKWLNRRLTENADREKIPYQWKRPIFGGTNAGRIHQTRSGIATAVVSVPCRYIHSPNSILSVEDIYHSMNLISAGIENKGNIGPES